MTFLLKPEFDRQGGQSAYFASERYHVKKLQENPSGVLWNPKAPLSPPPQPKGGRKHFKGKFLKIPMGPTGTPPFFQMKGGCQKRRGTRARFPTCPNAGLHYLLQIYHRGQLQWGSDCMYLL